jgi:hypothetical protein
MTEEQWLGVADPQQMFAFLRGTGRLSERKARLFAVACCRRVWPLLTDERNRKAIEVAERHADGEASDHELRRAKEESNGAKQRLPPVAAWAAGAATRAAYSAWDAGTVCRSAAWAAGNARRACVEEQAIQGHLLRDLFGPLPFRPVAVDPPVLRWNSGVAVRLARAAYESRSLPSGELETARLAVLADALEEAGCREPDLLGHCRFQGQAHVRGCWAIDLLLNNR